MSVETTSTDAVAAVLRAIRYGHAFGTMPLARTALVRWRTRDEGLADTPEAREMALAYCLHDIVALHADAAQGTIVDGDGAAPPGDLALLDRACEAQDEERLAWTVLYARFLSPARLPVSTIAARLGITTRTVRNRAIRGIELLASELRRAEAEAARRLKNSGEAIPFDLPPEPTRFVGREAELAELRRLLQMHRLVTVVGPAGFGKSRLALRLATTLDPELPDGARFVELAPLQRGATGHDVAARALGARAILSKPPIEALVSALRRRATLVVLDNCEHVLDGCAEVVRAVLAGCPSVQIVATSRESLPLDERARIDLRPMALPPASASHPERAVHYDAVQLFASRAGAGDPSFRFDAAQAAAVAGVCARLEGIPLAIELAAAQVRHLALSEIEALLDDRFRLLRTEGHVTRNEHASLLGAIDVSHDLLAPAERRLFQRLSVFRAPWTIATAAAVCSGEDLPRRQVAGLVRRLAAKSLIQAQGGQDGARFGMLETFREYAQVRLEAEGVRAAWRDRHLAHFVTEAEAAAVGLKGSAQLRWLARLDAGYGDLIEAIRWGCASGAVDGAQRIASGLAGYWSYRGRLFEGRAILDSVLAAGKAREASLPYAEALHAAGFLAVVQKDPEAALAPLEESLALKRALGGPLSIAATLSVLGIARFVGLQLQHGQPRRDPQALEAARGLIEEALETQRAHDDRHGMARSLNWLGLVVDHIDGREAARQRWDESAAVLRTVGDRLGAATPLNNLATLALGRYDGHAARALLEECIAVYRPIGDTLGLSISLLNLGAAEVLLGDPEQAVRHYAEALRLGEELGERMGSNALHGLAGAKLALGDLDGAERAFRELLSPDRILGSPLDVSSIVDRCAQIALARGDPLRALRLMGAAAALRDAVGATIDLMDAPDNERALALARAGVPRQVAERALAEGRALSPETAAAYALDAGAWEAPGDEVVAAPRHRTRRGRT